MCTSFSSNSQCILWLLHSAKFGRKIFETGFLETPIISSEDLYFLSFPLSFFLFSPPLAKKAAPYNL
ncbi:hypothetical protein PORCAN_688 [Porphyromonas crevioricanis JCM 13913]|nr:hypothetical protein PORCAN_688 [Porphyromonas crevioricanis JCM 13913]